ncbi:MAG TPA: PAS domain S-box protein [Pirellulaceae bacterium]|nr:PAS domain S-box protein [Pirellulaceae bacterium]
MADASDNPGWSGFGTRSGLRSQIVGYAVAAVATAVTTAIAVVVARNGGGYVPPLIYVPGIVIAAGIGGLGPGLLATTLAGLAATYFLFLPVGFAIADPNDYVRLSFLVGVGILLSGLLAATRRRREDIDEERERLRITLASIGDGVIRTDAMGRVTGINGVASELTGWSEEEGLGRSLTEVFRIVHETTHAEVDNPALRALREGRIVALANHTILLSKDGTARSIEDSAAPIRDSSGRVIGAVLVFRDVTAGRRAAKAFRSIDARRAAMLDSALDGIVAIDEEGLIIDFNPAAERIFGYPRSQALGREMAELIIPPSMRNAHREGLSRFLKSGEGRILNQRLELPAIRADGTEFPAEVSISPASVDDSRIFVGYIRDISERKRAERERTFFVELAAATQPLEDPAEVTQTAARLLAEHVGADRCAYAEVEDESVFVITGDYTRGVPSIVGRWPVEDFGAEIVRSMLADEAFVVEDSEDDPRIGPQDLPAYRATMIRSVICVPLFKGGRFTAAIAVHQKTVRRWTDHEIAFVRTVVDRCWEALQRSSALRQLRQSEERYRSLVTASSAIVWARSAAGEFEAPQPGWSEFTGQTFQQLRGWGWMDAIHPDDRAATEATWKQALATSSQYTVEHRLCRKDGQYRDMSVRAVPILDDAGQVREWVGIHTDVTERNRASEALRQSEERYRTLFETMDEGFCVAEVIYDESGRPVDYRFLEANPAFESQTGLANVVGKTALELAPGHEGHWAEIYGEVARTGKSVRFVNEARALNRWFDVNAFRVGGEGSVRVAQLFTDVTQRIATEQALAEAQSRLATTLATAEVGTWELDAAADRVLADAQLARLFSIPAEIAIAGEAPLARYVDAIHPDDRERVQTAIGRSLDTGEPYEIEYRLRRPDGSARWVLARGSRQQERKLTGILIDVTARKVAEEALGTSEERYRTLFETIDEGFCVVELAFDDAMRPIDYRIVEMNPAFERHTGLSNAIGRTIRELVPNLEPFWFETYGAVALTGEPTRFVHQAQPMGARWFDVYAFRIGDPEERRVAILFSDISERERADAELRESEERFRRMADDAPVMIWVTDPDGVCTYLSKSWYELTGQTPETGLGFGWVNATHPDDQAMTHEAFVSANSARAPFRVEYRLRRKDGEYGWFIDAATPRFAPNGEYLGYIGSVVDITDRQRTEQDRQAYEERFRTLVEQVEDYAIFMIDLEGRPTSWNEGVLRVLGFDEEEFVGQEINSAIFTPEDQAEGVPERELAQARETGTSNNDRWMRRKDGTRFYATGVTNSLNEQGQLLGYMKVMRDQTERKQMEDELRRVAADLSEADRRKNEFLATLAHELRNPLAPIRTGLELMRLNGDDPQETAEIRDVMERQTQQMMRLIDDLLEVARITQGKLELRTATVNLSDVVRSAVDASRPFIDEGGHELVVSVPAEPIRLEADPHRLQQVFSNLLNNAAKYTPDGGRIELSAAVEKGGVAVAVRDNGIGIPPEMKDRIFEMFAQIDRSMERSYSGLGIGLTLVKRLVEMHGGTIDVRSDGRDLGSEFVVHLPAKEARSEGEATEGRPDEASAAAGLRVLVVDDNRPAADILAKVIRLLGNEARTAYDGREGVAAADDYRPDVILMDLGMPNMNGYEATREIRKADWGGGILIVALTGWGQDEDRRRTEEAGFDRHFVKPVEPATLQKLLGETRKKAPG